LIKRFTWGWSKIKTTYIQHILKKPFKISTINKHPN
jgi:hypothetical protein